MAPLPDIARAIVAASWMIPAEWHDPKASMDAETLPERSTKEMESRISLP